MNIISNNIHNKNIYNKYYNKKNIMNKNSIIIYIKDLVKNEYYWYWCRKMIIEIKNNFEWLLGIQICIISSFLKESSYKQWNLFIQRILTDYWWIFQVFRLEINKKLFGNSFGYFIKYVLILTFVQCKIRNVYITYII